MPPYCFILSIGIQCSQWNIEWFSRRFFLFFFFIFLCLPLSVDSLWPSSFERMNEWNSRFPKHLSYQVSVKCRYRCHSFNCMEMLVNGLLGNLTIFVVHFIVARNEIERERETNTEEWKRFCNWPTIRTFGNGVTAFLLSFVPRNNRKRSSSSSGSTNLIKPNGCRIVFEKSQSYEMA